MILSIMNLTPDLINDRLTTNNKSSAIEYFSIFLFQNEKYFFMLNIMVKNIKL